MATRGGQPGNSNNRTHGFYSMKRTLTRLGSRAIDRRCRVGKALTKWRADLVRDLGGDISTQESAIVELCVTSKLLLDSIDSWLLVQPSLVSARKRALIPVVTQRQTLADSLARYLSQLGLQRRVKELTLEQLLQRESEECGEQDSKNDASDGVTRDGNDNGSNGEGQDELDLPSIDLDYFRDAVSAVITEVLTLLCRRSQSPSQVQEIKIVVRKKVLQRLIRHLPVLATDEENFLGGFSTVSGLN